MRSTNLRLAIVLLVCIPSLAAKSSLHKSSLKRLLARQGFSGLLEGKVDFSPLGTLHCGKKKLQVIFYEWEESNPPGDAIHYSGRILLLDHNLYLGFYAVEDRPKMRGSEAIVFEFPEEHENTIQCDTGGLPAQVLINGEPQLLQK